MSKKQFKPNATALAIRREAGESSFRNALQLSSLFQANGPLPDDMKRLLHGLEQRAQHLNLHRLHCQSRRD